MKRWPVWHPILFATYPILMVLATNPSQIFFAQLARPWIILVSGALVLLLGLRRSGRDWPRAGLLTTLTLFGLLYYGHLYRVTRGLTPAGFQIAHHLILLSLWGLSLGFIGSRWVWQRVRPHVITGLLNVISVVVLIFPLRTIVLLIIIMNRDPLTGWTRPPDPTPTHLAAAARPDIYYIIVDGYARADVLQQVYGLDNTEFIQFLTQRGFYVADQSQSNYIQTALSLPSSLNLEYLDDLQAAGQHSGNRDPAQALIGNSRVRTLLEEAGYQTVSFSSGFFYTEIRDSQLYLSPHRLKLNEFEQLLLGTSAAEILVELDVLDVPTFGYDTHRARINFALDQLAALPAVAGPKFVFAHILAPHPPFVFGADGQAIEPRSGYTQGDGNNVQGPPHEYIQGYRDQLVYINTQLKRSIDAILTRSKTPPIIILQADHGPGAYLSWESAQETCLLERTSILNAYYLPGQSTSRLYASISPVNSFRVIFDTYFGTQLGLLEDRVYYSTLTWPYDFIDVTGSSQAPCPTAPLEENACPIEQQLRFAIRAVSCFAATAYCIDRSTTVDEPTMNG